MSAPLSFHQVGCRLTSHCEILVHQPIQGPAHLIHSLLVGPSIAGLVLGSTPSVTTAGVRLHRQIASGSVRHGFDRLVFLGAVEESAMRSLAVRVGQVGPGRGGRHVGCCLRLGGAEGRWWG
jgi:hypothetical protein